MAIIFVISMLHISHLMVLLIQYSTWKTTASKMYCAIMSLFSLPCLIKQIIQQEMDCASHIIILQVFIFNLEDILDIIFNHTHIPSEA